MHENPITATSLDNIITRIKKSHAQGTRVNEIILTGETPREDQIKLAEATGAKIVHIGYLSDQKHRENPFGYFQNIFIQTARAEQAKKDVVICCLMGKDYSPALAQILNYARGKPIILSEKAGLYADMLVDAINLARKTTQIPRSQIDYQKIICGFYKEQKAAATAEQQKNAATPTTRGNWRAITARIMKNRRKIFGMIKLRRKAKL